MSGARCSVEYTGGTEGDRPEPAFIRQFKQRAGLQPAAALSDKFEESAEGGDKDRRRGERGNSNKDSEPSARGEEEMPQIVVTPGSGVTEAELAAVQARIRESGDESRFEEARSRVKFVQPTGGTIKRRSDGEPVASRMGDDAKRSRLPVAAVADKKLLSFDDEDGDD